MIVAPPFFDNLYLSVFPFRKEIGLKRFIPKAVIDNTKVLDSCKHHFSYSGEAEDHRNRHGGA